MDLMKKNYINRSQNELIAAISLMRLSTDVDAKKFFDIDSSITFYSAVISHAYYSIFYAAKALLLTKNIKTESPNIHKKTIDAFKLHFVDTGILDFKLFEIYQKLVVRADTLLEIFADEKWKRGNFTYNTIPQANNAPAEDSIENAKIFVSNIMKILQE